MLDTLKFFEEMSSQQVSMDKTSMIFSKGVPHQVRTNLVNISGFKKVNNLGRYPGIPLMGIAPRR